MRSPTVLAGSRRGPIITEELLISPDVSSPVIGLEKVDIRRRMMEEEAERRTGGGRSIPSSPRRPPMSPSSEMVKNSSSPLRAGQRTPSKLASSPARARALCQGGSPSPGLHPPSASTQLQHKVLQLHQGLRQAASPTIPAADSSGHSMEVLVIDSPQSSAYITPSSQIGSESKNNSTLATSLSNSPSLNVSDARRKLSFVVADSPIPSSANQSVIDLGEDTTSHIPSGNSSVCEKTEGKPAGTRSAQKIATAGGDGGHHVLSGIASPLRTSSPTAGLRETKNKRRSVCVQQRPAPPSVEESSDEGDLSPENRSIEQSSGEEEENKENTSAEVEADKEDDENEEESDGENKENDQIAIRRGGGRNRFVSESESSEGSCYEVPESEDEVTDDQKPGSDDDDCEEEKKPSLQGD